MSESSRRGGGHAYCLQHKNGRCADSWGDVEKRLEKALSALKIQFFRAIHLATTPRGAPRAGRAGPRVRRFFGSFDKFKEEFAAAARDAEGVLGGPPRGNSSYCR